MNRLREMVQLETHCGETIVASGLRVTPQSRALTVTWPGGGWVWNRPVALEVEQDGEVRQLPIVDVTRWGQIALAGLTVLFSVATVLLAVRSLVQADAHRQHQID
jgi:hypothetical protein